MFRILLADGGEVGIAFHHGYRIQTGTIIGTTETGNQIATVFLIQLHEFVEVVESLRKGNRPFIIKSPKLFSVIKAQQVWKISVEFFVHRQIKIGEVAEAAAGRLNQYPHLILGTGPQPGFGSFITIFNRLIFTGGRVVIDGK